MKLEDIPALREQFRKIETDRVAKIRQLPPIPTTGDIDYAKFKRGGEISRINIDATKEQRALCEKVFGYSLSSYEFDVDPDEVLDWIEHFLQVDHV